MKLEDKVITGLATSDDDSSITIKDFKAENISSLFEDIATLWIWGKLKFGICLASRKRNQLYSRSIVLVIPRLKPTKSI